MLTTHVGSLEIPGEVLEALRDDPSADSPVLRDAVVEIVKQQAEAGIDIIDDGEFGKAVWNLYAGHRMNGVEWRAETNVALMRGRDYVAYPGFYDWAVQTPGVLVWNDPGEIVTRKPVCVGPLSYRPEAVQRDIRNLKSALEGVDVVDAFMPSVAPASIEAPFANEHYGTQEELLYAIADALREEYRAIVDGGFLLQVDDAWVPLLWSQNSDIEPDEYRRVVARCMDALNHALEGLPQDGVRYHVCWGSWHGAHSADVPSTRRSSTWSSASTPAPSSWRPPTRGAGTRCTSGSTRSSRRGRSSRPA